MKTLVELIRILTSESNNAVNWFSKNKMIVNLCKFKSIVVQNSQVLNQPTYFMIRNNKVNIDFSVNPLRINIDNQLSSKQHISNICKSAFNHLNALGRLKTFLRVTVKSLLIVTFISSNFSYCQLVWLISSAKSLNKVKRLKKRTSRFWRNDYVSSYDQPL